MGASVMHEDAVFPVRNAGVPTSIRNTGNPQHPGTIIVPSPRQIGRMPVVTGIAGKRGFSTIILEKNRMNDEIGFGRKVLSVLERHHLNFEHLPTGIDALCVMISTSALSCCRQAVLEEIEAAVHPDSMMIQDGIALVACVGTGLLKVHGTIARLFTAICEQGIPIRTMFQAPSALSIIVGIDEEHLETAIRAIYDAFIRD
jgi:aspartate kinase